MSGKTKKLYGTAAVFLLLGLQTQQCLANGPDTVVLESIAQYYEPVNFDHAMHADMVGKNNCSTCHHHTLGTPVTNETCKKCHAKSGEAYSAACRDCHPAKRFESEYLAKLEADHQIYHVDKPGLKGAYHQNCLGCHEEMGGPTGCQDCHTRTDSGDKFFRSGKYAPSSSKSKEESHH